MLCVCYFNSRTVGQQTRVYFVQKPVEQHASGEQRLLIYEGKKKNGRLIISNSINVLHCTTLTLSDRIRIRSDVWRSVDGVRRRLLEDGYKGSPITQTLFVRLTSY